MEVLARHVGQAAARQRFGPALLDARRPTLAQMSRIGVDPALKAAEVVRTRNIDGEEALVYTAGSPLRRDVKGPGYWVFTPAQLAGGSMVLVNRGFIPIDRKDPATRSEGTPHGSVDIVGVIRWPEKRTSFTPPDDPKDNVWYLRDSDAIAASKKWLTAAPFYIDQESPVPQGGTPKPGKLEVHLPDNHLEYAITWFGLALALAGVYVAWLARRLVGRY